MKQKRQAKILSIIEQYDIETQDELLKSLLSWFYNDSGYDIEGHKGDKSDEGGSCRRQAEVYTWQEHEP